MKKESTGGNLFLYLAILLVLLINCVLLFGLTKEEGQNPVEDLAITFITTPNCDDCFSLDAFKEYFVENGVEDDQMKEYNYDSFIGRYFIWRYSIKEAPTVVITGDDFENIDYMKGLVDTVGEFRNNAFIVTRLQPPYLDLETKEIVGIFDAIYLEDASCQECYDVTTHERLFQLMAIEPNSISRIDINSEEGQRLVNDYFITSIPTLLLTGDLTPYEQLNEIWPGVGTIEQDGTYVFRRGNQQMGIYKQLPEGDIINPLADEASDE